MKLRFSIHYATAWGENLHVVITYKSRDGRLRTHNVLMQTFDGELWVVETAVMESRQHPVESFDYYYQVENSDGEVLRKEWNKVKRCFAFDSTKDYVFPDLWRDTPLLWHLYTNAVNGRKYRKAVGDEAMKLPLYRKTVVFRVSAPQLATGEVLGVCGSHPSLGEWSPSRYLCMEYLGDYEWTLSVNVDNVPLPIEYKYVVVDGRTHQVITWEDGDNRVVSLHNLQNNVPDDLLTAPPMLRNGQVLVLNGEPLRLKETMWKAAGVVVPLFSLRSEHSYGVGDFGDLLRLTDWAVATGMKVIQVLPLNDTTSTHSWTDSHPYNCISVFALHPHYIDLEQLGALASKQEMTAFARQRRELNALADSDYMAVDRVKSDYIAKAFAEQGEATLTSDDFYRFYQIHRAWLEPYAAFCALRDKFGTSRFSDWQQYAVYDQKAVAALSQQGASLAAAIRQTYFVQYHLHRQLQQAADYARSKGIVLKGDVPVGVYRDSVEAWMHPDYFNMDMHMGTPPSAAEPMGQNWGFPTYRWSSAVEEWFRLRLHYMERYFDAVRIDHIVSFFRVWEIPAEQISATMGHFAPALPLSEEEIGRYGLVFRRDLFTQPLITDRILERVFGIHAQYVRDNFLTRKAYNFYGLKAEVDTQKKIRNRFYGQNDENSLWIRDGLCRLCAGVLFLEDPWRAGMYHPRFGAFNEPVYEALSAEDKDAFMRLYNHYYYERHNGYWEHLAQKKLSAVLSDTRMLVCAEDLGMLPDCVPAVLDSQRILTLEIQSLPKQHGAEFSHLSSFPYRSVATISTHDMPPLRLWWEENPGRTQRYFAAMLQKEGRAPRRLTSMIAEEIIARHLYSPSMLCLLSVQDWLAMSSLKLPEPYTERINAPYDCYNQWKYRMSITLEQLIKSTQLNLKLKTMINRSKRTGSTDKNSNGA